MRHRRAKKTDALIRSIVFHPRLIGSLDSIYYQKAVLPLYKNNALPYALIGKEKSWERECNALILEGWNALEKETDFYEVSVHSCITKALCLLVNHSVLDSSLANGKQMAQAERMKAMLEYIEHHLEEEIDLSILSKITYSSKSSVLRTFEEYLGTTPMQYIKRLRIQKAASLLRNSNEKCAVIAGSCGFNDISYFNRSFKAAYGCSPLAYRKGN